MEEREEGEESRGKEGHFHNPHKRLWLLLPDYVFSALSDNDDAPWLLSAKAFTQLQSRRQLVRKMIIKYKCICISIYVYTIYIYIYLCGCAEECAGIFLELLWHLRTFTLAFMAFGDRNVCGDWCSNKFPGIQYINLLINLWQCVEAAHSGWDTNESWKTGEKKRVLVWLYLPVFALAWSVVDSVHSFCSTGHRRCTNNVQFHPVATVVLRLPHNLRTLDPLRIEIVSIND